MSVLRRYLIYVDWLGTSWGHLKHQNFTQDAHFGASLRGIEGEAVIHKFSAGLSSITMEYDIPG